MDERLLLGVSEHWSAYLFANQCYLGRVQLNLRRACTGSLADLDEAEWLDLRDLIKRVEATAADLFGAAKFNYKQLGNQWPQVHVHVIPRYGRPPVWNGVAFPDRRWGDDPYPEFESPVGTDETVRLAGEVKARLALADIG